MFYDSRTVMGCDEMISITVDALKRRLPKRANIRRIVGSVTKV